MQHVWNRATELNIRSKSLRKYLLMSQLAQTWQVSNSYLSGQLFMNPAAVQGAQLMMTWLKLERKRQSAVLKVR